MLELFLLTRSKKLSRLAVRSPYLTLVGASALLIAFWTVVLDAIGSPVGVIVTVDVLYLLLVSYAVWSAPTRAMREAVSSLNDLCDPYPMLELCETLLRRRSSTKRRLDVTLNYCIALDMVGEHQRAYDLLASVPVGTAEETSPMPTVGYCAALASICTSLDRKAQAMAYLERVLTRCETVSDTQERTGLAPTVSAARAYMSYLAGDYESCLVHLKSAAHSTLLDEMRRAWLYANASLAIGDMQTAKKKLHRIVQQGHRLHLVDEAKKLLKTIGS